MKFLVEAILLSSQVVSKKVTSLPKAVFPFGKCLSPITSGKGWEKLATGPFPQLVVETKQRSKEEAARSEEAGLKILRSNKSHDAMSPKDEEEILVASSKQSQSTNWTPESISLLVVLTEVH